MNEVSARSVGAAVESESGPDLFTLRQRIVLRMIAWVGYWVIRLIGPTLRVGISREEGAPETLEQRPVIASFWHACIIPATYMFRGLGVRVLSSNSYDGEYTGRIIRKFGFVPVKGSSRRNAVPALLGLRLFATRAFILGCVGGNRHRWSFVARCVAARFFCNRALTRFLVIFRSRGFRFGILLCGFHRTSKQIIHPHASSAPSDTARVSRLLEMRSKFLIFRESFGLQEG